MKRFTVRRGRVPGAAWTAWLVRDPAGELWFVSTTWVDAVALADDVAGRQQLVMEPA